MDAVLEREDPPETEEKPFARKMRLAKERAAAARASATAVALEEAEAPIEEPSEIELLRQELAELRQALFLANSTSAGHAAEATAAPPETAAAKAQAARKKLLEAVPDLDPDTELRREVARVMGTATPPPPPPVMDYVDDEDPQRQATRLAIEMLQADAAHAEARRRARVADPQRSLEEENRRYSAIDILTEAPEEPNPFAFEDDDGTNLLPPGYVGHWVRVKPDLEARADNRQRLRSRLAWGAEVITKADGAELRTDTLVATKIPIKREAQRKLHLADPGAFSNARSISTTETDRLRQVADEENSRYSRRYHGGGKGVLHITTPEQSGMQYGPADMYDEDL